MTLYELTTAITLQGNIELKIFAVNGNETESRYFRDLSAFDIICTDTNDLEDCEVTYIYATKSATGDAWTVVELALIKE